MGTVAYMSPEQARGEELDARTDLFSFGLVLYEMATGPADIPGQHVGRGVRRDPQPRAARRRSSSTPTCRWRSSALIARAIEKDRERRFASAAEMRVALEEVRRERDSSSSRRAAVASATESPSGSSWPSAGVTGRRRSRARQPRRRGPASRGRRRHRDAAPAGAARRQRTARVRAGAAVVLRGDLRRLPRGLSPRRRRRPGSRTERRRPAHRAGAGRLRRRDPPPPRRAAGGARAATAAPAPAATPPARARSQAGTEAGAPAAAAAAGASGRARSRDAETATTRPPRCSRPRRPRSTQQLLDQALDDLKRGGRDLLQQRHRPGRAAADRPGVRAAESARRRAGRVRGAAKPLRHSAAAADATFQLAELVARESAPTATRRRATLYGEVFDRFPKSAAAPQALSRRAALEDKARLRLVDTELQTSVPASLVTYRSLVRGYPSSPGGRSRVRGAVRTLQGRPTVRAGSRGAGAAGDPVPRQPARRRLARRRAVRRQSQGPGHGARAAYALVPGHLPPLSRRPEEAPLR